MCRRYPAWIKTATSLYKLVLHQCGHKRRTRGSADAYAPLWKRSKRATRQLGSGTAKIADIANTAKNAAHTPSRRHNWFLSPTGSPHDVAATIA